MSIENKLQIIQILRTKLATINQIISSLNEACSILKIENSYNQLIQIQQRDSNTTLISINTLNWLLEIISLRNDQAYPLIIDAIQMLVYNQILPQASYLLILRIFDEILHQTKEHSSLILELLMKMIKPESIQISTQNIQRLFLLGVLLHSHLKQKTASAEYLNQLTITLFQFLNALLNPVIIKQNKKVISSCIDLDDIKDYQKNTSFYTVTESQSEIENIQQDKDELNEKTIEIDLNEYKECDIYLSSYWIFQYLLNILNGKCNESSLSKSISIDIILKIIFATNNLLLNISDFIKLIRNELGVSLSNILRLNVNFDLRFKAIKLSFYIISTYHYCYDLIPLCLNKNGYYNSIEKYICYELVSKFLRDTILLSDLYALLIVNETDIKEDNILDKSIMSLLSREALNSISALPIKVTYSQINCFDDNNDMNTCIIYRGHYISVISEISNSLEYTHISVLNTIKISLDSFVSLPFDTTSQQYIYIRNKIIYYFTYIKNILSFLAKEDKKGMLNMHIDRLIVFIKIYSIFHLNKLKDELFELIIEVINHQITSNESLIYCGKEIFVFAEQKQFNQDIESWLCLIKVMMSLFTKVHNTSNNNLFIPLPSIDLENYIKFIEHHLRIFSFDYYDSIFANEIDDVTTEEYSNCIGTMTDCSIIETKDTNKSSPIFSCIKVRKLSTFRKKSSNMLNETSFVENTLNLNAISDLIETFYFSNTASYDDNYLITVIFNAFVKSSTDINKQFKNNTEDILKLKFIMMKVTDILSCNLSRINLFWDKFTAILYDVFVLNYCELSVMAFDVLIIISMLIIHSYKDEYNMYNEWNLESYQCTVLSSINKFILPILNKTNEILHFIIDDMYTFTNIFGKKLIKPAWEKLIQIIILMLESVDDTYIVYSLCELVFDYFDLLISFQYSDLVIKIVHILLSKSKSKVKEACINQLIIISKKEGNNDENIKSFIFNLCSILHKQLIDGEYIIRKKVIELIKYFNNEKNYLSYTSYYELMKTIYEKYKEKQKTENKQQPGSNSTKIVPSKSKEKQEEIEWEDTLISGLTILSIQDLLKSFDFFSFLMNKWLTISSPKIINQIIHILNDIEKLSKNNLLEGEIHLITNLINYISSDLFIQNFVEIDSPLMNNCISLLNTLSEHCKLKQLISQNFLIKLLKAATGNKLSAIYPSSLPIKPIEINNNETIVFDFIQSIHHQHRKDIFEFYFFNINAIDNNNPFINEYLCLKAINELLYSYSNSEITQSPNDNIDLLNTSFSNLIKLCYNKHFQQKCNLSKSNLKPIWSIAFLSYSQIVSMLIKANNNTINQLKLYDQMLLLSEYILNQTDDLLLFDLIDYLTTELLLITNEQFYSCRSRFIALFTEYLFKLKNNTANNAMIEQLFKQTNKLADKLIERLIKKKIECFMDDEKKNEISMPRVRVNEIELILKFIKEYVIENENNNDGKAHIIKFIKREMELMMESKEIILGFLVKEICNYINVNK